MVEFTFLWKLFILNCFNDLQFSLFLEYARFTSVKSKFRVSNFGQLCKFKIVCWSIKEVGIERNHRSY